MADLGVRYRSRTLGFWIGTAMPNLGRRSSMAPDNEIASQSMPAPTTNADAPWDVFSSDGYFRHNYQSLWDEDREIISRVGAFFASVFSDRCPVRRAIDVGSGTNLYPALLMLPW